MPKPRGKKILLLNGIIKLMAKAGRKRKRSKPKEIILHAKVMDKLVKGNKMSKIATSLNIPRTTLYRLLQSDFLWENYKKTQKQVLDAEFSKIAVRSLKEARKKIKKASYSQLMVGSAIAHDKIYPQYLMAQQFNIGTKKIEVKMPSFFKPRRKK